MTYDANGSGSWTIERVVTDRDLEAVLEIEALSFTNPWTREMYLREMDNPRVSHITSCGCEAETPTLWRGSAPSGSCRRWPRSAR